MTGASCGWAKPSRLTRNTFGMAARLGSLVKTPMKNEAGEITGVLGIFWDITEKKQMEDAVQASEARFRMLIEKSPVAINISRAGRTIYVNRKFLELYGYQSVEELAGRPIGDDLAPECREMITERTLRRAHGETVPSGYEGIGQRKDGSQFPVEIKVSQVELPDGPAATAFLTDITERKRTENLVRQSQEEFKDLFNNAPIGYYELDAGGRIVRINEIHSKMLGCSAGELLGQFVWKNSADEELSRRTVLAKLAGEKPPSESFERTLRRKDGSTFPVLIIDRLLKREDGAIIGIHGTVQDITERKRTEAALQASESRFRTLIEKSPVAISISRAGRTIYVNQRCLDLYGYQSVEELVGQSVAVQWAPELRETIMERVMRRARGEPAPSEYEGIGQRKDGSQFPAHADVSRVELPDGPASMAFLTDITERKRAEQELLASEAELLSILESTGDGILAVDRDGGRVIRVNRRFAEMWRIPQSIIDAGDNRAQLNFVLEQLADPAAFLKRVNELYGTDTVAMDTLVFKDGRIFERHGFPMMLNGTVLGRVCSFRDITERKRTEKEIEQTAREWQTTFDAMEEAVWILDQNNRILRTNKAAEKYFSRPCCDMMGKPCWEIMHCTTEPIPNCPFVRARKTVHRETVELQQGGRWLEVAVDPIKDAGGGFAGAVHIVSDITGRKRVEVQVKEALDFNRTIISDAAVGIVAYKASGQCILANEAAAKTLNGAVPALLEQNFRQLVSWRASGLLEMAEEVLATQESRNCEAHLTTSFGREVWLVSHFSHFSQNGEPHLLIIFIDATDQKKLEVQFLRSQRMESLGTLAGGIAHDLNNVLAPILISIQLLKEEIADPALKKLLDALETNVNRGADLVQQVLVFGRGVKSDREIVHVQHVAHEIKNIVRETFPKSLEFQLEVARNLWPVFCDPTQIHQVLLNLAINARDSMPGGGKLSLRLENITLDQAYAGRNPEAKPGPYVLISVQDTGTGIPAEVQERMFEPFFTTKEQGKGTGLGLSTTLRIVKSHGGFILCDSAPGRGTVFKVHLPASAATAAATSSKTTQMPRGHNELILVVDDEASILEIAQATLTHFGYRVLPATNGAEAVEIYRKRRDEIAAVITDMAMPVMDGPATIIALQAINPDVKIIASSGFSSKMTMPGKSRVPFKHFIHKPYSSAKLLQEIHATLHEDSTEESAPKKDKGRPGVK